MDDGRRDRDARRAERRAERQAERRAERQAGNGPQGGDGTRGIDVGPGGDRVGRPGRDRGGRQHGGGAGTGRRGPRYRMGRSGRRRGGGGAGIILVIVVVVLIGIAIWYVASRDDDGTPGVSVSPTTSVISPASTATP